MAPKCAGPTNDTPLDRSRPLKQRNGGFGITSCLTHELNPKSESQFDDLEFYDWILLMASPDVFSKIVPEVEISKLTELFNFKVPFWPIFDCL